MRGEAEEQEAAQQQLLLHSPLVYQTTLERSTLTHSRSRWRVAYLLHALSMHDFDGAL